MSLSERTESRPAAQEACSEGIFWCRFHIFDTFNDWLDFCKSLFDAIGIDLSGGSMKSVYASSVVVAALSAGFGSVHAEGFNFYALLDGGIASTSISKGGASKTEFVTGGYAPNFFGLTSEKSLGSGLTGGFKLEQGFLLTGKDVFGDNAAFGPDGLFNRQANLYVKGGFGTVTVGTQGNIAFSSVLLGEPRAGSNFGSALASIDLDGKLGTVDQGAVSYASPVSGGFSVAATFVPEKDATKSGQRLAGTYAGKDFAVSLAGYNDDAGHGITNKGTVLSGNYKLGAVTFKGLSVTQKTSVFSSLGTVGAGGAYALNADTTLDFGVFKTTDSKAHYDVSTWAAGIQYKFLKDLTVYGQYASVKNNDTQTAAFNFAGPSSANLTSSIGKGQTANTFNIGLLYGFF